MIFREAQKLVAATQHFSNRTGRFSGRGGRGIRRLSALPQIAKRSVQNILHAITMNNVSKQKLRADFQTPLLLHQENPKKNSN
jgi:hypothetical protein